MIANQVTYLLEDVGLSHFGWLLNNNEFSALSSSLVAQEISGAIKEEGSEVR